MALDPYGQVMGTDDAFALDFWVNVDEQRYLQLDDVVTVPIVLPDGQPVTIRYFDEDISAAVAEEPLFDPEMQRLRS